MAPRSRPTPLSERPEYEVVVKNTFLEIAGSKAKPASPCASSTPRAARSPTSYHGGCTAPASMSGALHLSLLEMGASTPSTKKAKKPHLHLWDEDACDEIGGTGPASTPTSTPGSGCNLHLWPATPGTPGAPVEISLVELMGDSPQAAPEIAPAFFVPAWFSAYGMCQEELYRQVDFGPPVGEPVLPPPPLASPKFSVDMQRQLEEAAATTGGREEVGSEVIACVPHAPAPKCAPPCAPAAWPEQNPHAGWQMKPPLFAAPTCPPPPMEAPKNTADGEERLSPRCAWQCTPPPSFDAPGEVSCH